MSNNGVGLKTKIDGKSLSMKEVKIGGGVKIRKMVTIKKMVKKRK